MVGLTRSEAISALQVEIAQRIARGKLLSLEVEERGVSSLAGKYRSAVATGQKRIVTAPIAMNTLVEVREDA